MAGSVLITGASSGIGEMTARHLSSQGWQVFGTSRREREDQDGIRFVVMDVQDSDSVNAALSQVLNECVRLDALVCNAGMGIFGAVEEVSLEHAKDQFETNYFGVLRVLRAALPSMREAKHGRVLLVGSLAGRAPLPFQSHYSSSKAAIDALSGSLHTELAPFGIHVSLIEPGDISTPFNEAVNWAASPDDSAYGKSVRTCEKMNREHLSQAPAPLVAARCIERALTTRRPRTRYTVGADAWLVPLGRRFLPDRISLALIRRHYGL